MTITSKPQSRVCKQILIVGPRSLILPQKFLYYKGTGEHAINRFQKIKTSKHVPDCMGG